MQIPPHAVYCDMDDVLVDLIGGIRRLYGFNAIGSWSSHNGQIEPMKAVIDRDHPDLFAKLPWMEDGRLLWNYLHQAGVSPRILSARTTTWQPNCVRDKTRWIRRELRPQPSAIHIVERDRKQDFAVAADGTRNILIDDWDRNIVEWEKRGGIGILHTSAKTSIEALMRLGYAHGPYTEQTA